MSIDEKDIVKYVLIGMMERRAQLDEHIAALRSEVGPDKVFDEHLKHLKLVPEPAHAPAPAVKPTPTTKRVISPETRAKMSRLMKKRWKLAKAHYLGSI